MAVGKTSTINPIISNISFYKGSIPHVKTYAQTNEYVVTGNPTRPVSRNNDENAGPLKGLGVYYLA